MTDYDHIHTFREIDNYEEEDRVIAPVKIIDDDTFLAVVLEVSEFKEMKRGYEEVEEE